MMNNENHAEPFTVDLGDVNNERTFKQVRFPGEEGTYRLRVVNLGNDLGSTVTQKHVNTGIQLSNINGEVFRVKAVLDQEIDGISESHWLTLHHTNSSDILALNQYRIRGVSEEGYLSDWVYSNLKDNDNETIIYEMLYDLLDIIMTTRDADIEAFLSYVVEDAYKSLLEKEKTSITYLFDQTEKLTADMSESKSINQDIDNSHLENYQIQLKDLFNLIGQNMATEFKEVFMSSSDEFVSILKMYKASDAFKNRMNDLTTMVVEVFLEDALDRIIENSKIELLVENEGNQSIFLEGSYNLDIKSELVRSSYDIMPTDDFFLNANSTVQLIIGPVLSEEITYQYVEQLHSDLRYFKNEMLEVIVAEPTEEVLMLVKMYLNEGVFPYLMIDQMSALVSTEIMDQADLVEKIGSSIVDYSVITESGYEKYMIIKDVVDELIIGGLPPKIDKYFIGLTEKLSSKMSSTAYVLVQYGIDEVYDVIEHIGENLQHGYRRIKKDNQENFTAILKDDSYKARSSLEPKAYEEEKVGIEDKHSYHVKETKKYEEIFQFLNEEIVKYYEKSNVRMNDNIMISIAEKSSLIGRLIQRLSEYYTVQSSEKVSLSSNRKSLLLESMQVKTDYAFNPVYLPYLSDRRNKEIEELPVYIEIHPQLVDIYEISGKEKIQYALGNEFDEGWPLGIFELGTNTLKGAE